MTFPTGCAVCGGELTSHTGVRICIACWSSLVPWDGPVCSRCGLPFASARALDSAVKECGACRLGGPAFDSARSFGLYTGKLRQVILRLKFGGEERLGVRLGELLVPTWRLLPRIGGVAPCLMMPIPLHPARQRERGFNQSDLLAEGLVRALRKQGGSGEVRLCPEHLRRKRATPPQTGLSVAARRENLRGAFEVVRPEAVRARTVALIDDVMTTGATLSACARVLKRAGAAQVMGVTLARATPQFPDLVREERDNSVDGLGGDST